MTSSEIRCKQVRVNLNKIARARGASPNCCLEKFTNAQLHQTAPKIVSLLINN